MTTDTLHYIEMPLCTRTDKERETKHFGIFKQNLC